MQAGRKRVVLGVVVVLLSCAAIAYAFVRANAGAFRLPVAAMEPTIKAGETVWADLLAYETADPQRWDLVVFRSPQLEDKIWIFRVVGMPGETISFGRNGMLINGRPADLPDHLRNVSYSALTVRAGVDHPFVVPQLSYYVLGDNPVNANDSRVWGAVTRDRILGKVNAR